MARTARAVYAVRTTITNRIRYVLDEVLPPSIRNARWFMLPFFAIWFKGKNVRTAMDFKGLAPSMSDSEFREVYRCVTTLADGRPTDTNAEALQYVLSKIDGDARSLLDVGCGRGYFISMSSVPKIVGCDLLDQVELRGAAYATASAERLPFRDRSFDVVTCFHTLEHMRDVDAAIAELKRVTRKQLIVIVPRQRYFQYTLDLHLQFFPTAETLEAKMRMGGEIRQFGSDLVYISVT